MSDSEQFDFWYALENTHLLQGPVKSLETFGTTRVKYHLITEVMDSVNQVRVREGVLNAAQPQILTPNFQSQSPIDGFEDAESDAFMRWLREHKPELRFLHYGFQISKTEVSDHLIHESPAVVEGNVLEQVSKESDGFSAVLRGVEHPWEVCLLKLMVDLVEKSMPVHVKEFQGRNLLPNPRMGEMEIEEDFAAAQRDASRIPYLHKKLQQRQVFDQYQDRFFDLVRRSGGMG
ncbi:hypothetical protein P3T73_13500 [Kiritimatiellota bacterium B12222]|nr:hypothetical protein P3T73_13500 [Kiritimatiellota bacterium B12222]